MLGDSAFVKAQYKHDYAHSLPHLVKLCMERQFKVMFRNKEVGIPIRIEMTTEDTISVFLLQHLQFLLGSVVQSAFMALVLGSLFWNLGRDEVNLKFGVLTFAVLYTAFGSMVRSSYFKKAEFPAPVILCLYFLTIQSEMPVIMEQRPVVQKQTAAKFYPSLVYGVSVVIFHIPIAAIQSIVLGSILYWMTNLAEDAGRFFFFLLVLFTASMTMSTFSRIIAFASKNMEVAETESMHQVALIR